MLIPFSPPPGLNSDDTSFAAEGRWTDGNNVRFYNGKPQVIGGQTEVFTLAQAADAYIRCIFPFRRAGSLAIAYGVGAAAPKLYVGSGVAAPSDETPASLSAAENWSFGSWGDTLLAVPEGGTLYEQSGAATATEVTQAPDAITYMLVTQERQVLAFGCNEEVSGTFNGLCIRGCDLEDYTDWTTSPTNNAFEHILDGSGSIVGARVIGQYIAVWTTSALYLGQFLGDPGQTYRFDKVDDHCGLAGPNSVVVHNQRAFWVGPDLRIRTWAPGESPQLVLCPLSRRLNGTNTAAIRYIAASANSRFNEIRFDFADGAAGSAGPIFPTGGSTNSAYISVALDGGHWFQGAGGRSAILDSGVALGSYTDSPTIIAAYGNTVASVRLHETGSFTWGFGTEASLQPYIKSAAQALDNSSRRLMIRSVAPDFEAQVGDVSMTISVRSRPQEAALDKGPFTLTTATTKLGCRCSGKLFEVKLAGGTQGGSFFRLGKFLFDVVILGER